MRSSSAFAPLALLLVGIALGSGGALLTIWWRKGRAIRALGASSFVVGSGMVGAGLLRVTENPFLVGFLGALYILVLVAAVLAFEGAPRVTPTPGRPTARDLGERPTRVVDRNSPPPD